MPRRRDINRLQSEIEELFADLWQVPRFSGLHRALRPNVDCYRTGEPPELTVVVELPGIDPDEVQVVVNERTLSITGERRRPRSEGNLLYQQMEIEYGPFQRRIALPEDVDPEGARAEYERGLLTVVLPVATRAAEDVKVSIQVTRGD